ncbi:MAG: hypothetical protein M3Q63_00715 [bacterium]|nr:hypothetical protein [bacterium]
MIQLRTQQHIRFVTVEKPTAIFVYAILLETTGNETVAISEPKLVKVVARKGQLALKGTVPTLVQALPAPLEVIGMRVSKVVSPFFAFIFGSEVSNFIMGIAPQPPTNK